VNNSSADNFVAPTVEQVTDHLEQHPPTGPSRLSAWGPLLILGTVALLALASNDARMQWLAWLALGGVVLFWAVRMKRMRDLDRMVVQVQELGMRRLHVQSLRLAWRRIPNLSAVPPLHGRTVAFMVSMVAWARNGVPYRASRSVCSARLAGASPSSRGVTVSPSSSSRSSSASTRASSMPTTEWSRRLSQPAARAYSYRA